MNNTLNCLILHQKCRFLTKEKRRKSLICSVLLILTFGSSGATGIRTRDTRIFSPLLYQLSYGTIVCATFFGIASAKVVQFFDSANFFKKNIKKSYKLLFSIVVHRVTEVLDLYSWCEVILSLSLVCMRLIY